MITLPSGRKIGKGEPIFIIAEVGSNWENLSQCIESIHMAKECGADAVKFQLFTHEALYGFPGEMAGCLPMAWLKELKAQANVAGIEFMCSAFSPDLIAAVDPFVNIHKLASAEMLHAGMLKKLQQKGKPVLISTGGHNLSQVKEAIKGLRPIDAATKAPEIIPMFCVSAYPAQEIDLRKIGLLRDHTLLDIGYSDHSLDILVIPQQAQKEGAVVIEKHFTTFPELKTADRPHSLAPNQFTVMVKGLRGKYQVNPWSVENEEMEARAFHNRTLIACRDIKQGEMIWEGLSFGMYRAKKPKGETNAG